MIANNKVFFIAPCLAMGGMERASVNTANGLVELGVDVIYLSIFKKSHFYSLHKNVVLIEPVNINIRSLDIINTIIWIRKNIKSMKPTHILVFGKFYGALTAIALLGIKIPFFISERSSPYFNWKFPINLINFAAYHLRPPTGVIAQTEIASKYQSKYYKRSKIVVIPNSLREVKLYPECKRENVILAVGRLNDYLKGFDLLIESFSMVKNKNWELHIAGGDGNADVLKKQATNLGIDHRIKFLGQVKDIDFCYAYAGIYVIPSRSEGFPNSLAEAMSAGCCCIAFDFVAGPRDLIDNNFNGIIVPNGDTKQMALMFDKLITHESIRNDFGKKAMEIRERLTLIKIVEEVKKFMI